MRRGYFTRAVKMDPPYIVADMDATLALDEAPADFAVVNKLGVHVGGAFDIGPTRAELEAEEARIGTLTKLGEAREVPVVKREDGDLIPEERTVIDPADLTSDPEAHERVTEPKRPYGNAPKSAWIRYAVGMSGIKGCPVITEEGAEEMSK